MIKLIGFISSFLPVFIPISVVTLCPNQKENATQKKQCYNTIFNAHSMYKANPTMVSSINSMDAKSESGVKSLRNQFTYDQKCHARKYVQRTNYIFDKF